MDASPDMSSTDLTGVASKAMFRAGSRLKRCFDVFAAVAIIIFISPIYLIIAIAIKLTDNGPVFYSHRRVGQFGQEFGCLKFRTMATNGDALLSAYLAQNPQYQAEWQATRKLRNDPRVTAIGRFLRKFSLDEIPQLFNVVRGEMSLVGPRPVVTDELSFYGMRSHLYFRVRPGLTGLWQVSGRSDLAYDARVELDCRYVENWSFARDFVILLRTIPAVCLSRGSC